MASKPKYFLNLDQRNIEELHQNQDYSFTSKKQIEKWLLENGKYSLEWRYGFIVKFKELPHVCRFVDENNDTIKFDV